MPSMNFTGIETVAKVPLRKKTHVILWVLKWGKKKNQEKKRTKTKAVLHYAKQLKKRKRTKKNKNKSCFTICETANKENTSTFNDFPFTASKNQQQPAHQQYYGRKTTCAYASPHHHAPLGTVLLRRNSNGSTSKHE